MSNEESNELEQLKAKQKYLKEWLVNFKSAQGILPAVNMMLEITDWQFNALNNRPEEASEISLAGSPIKRIRDFDYLKNALPIMARYDSGLLYNSTAFTTSGSTDYYDYVARVGDLGTPDAIAYSKEFTSSYQSLQFSQERPKAVRILLEKLNNNQTLERFDRAETAYIAEQSGTGNRTAAALEMRTFLEGVKGDLIELARHHERENMPWEKMAERLAVGGSSGSEYQELLSQKAKYSSLISRLSAIAKDREGGSLTDLKHIWTQVLDHIYTILVLIDFSK